MYWIKWTFLKTHKEINIVLQKYWQVHINSSKPKIREIKFVVMYLSIILFFRIDDLPSTCKY